MKSCARLIRVETNYMWKVLEGGSSEKEVYHSKSTIVILPNIGVNSPASPASGIQTAFNWTTYANVGQFLWELNYLHVIGLKLPEPQ